MIASGEQCQAEADSRVCLFLVVLPGCSLSGSSAVAVAEESGSLLCR